MSQYSTQESDIKRRQMLAQALAESGNIGADRLSQTAGGYVVPLSGWEQVNSVANKLLSAYMGMDAQKKETALNDQKTADAKKQVAGLVDQLAGPSKPQALNTSPMAAGSDVVDVTNPVTGAKESQFIGTEQNPQRQALAGMIQGMDPQQAAQMLMGPAMQRALPEPITPYQEATLKQQADDAKMRRDEANIDNKRADAQLQLSREDNIRQDKMLAETVREHNQVDAARKRAEEAKYFDPVKDQTTVDLIAAGKMDMPQPGKSRGATPEYVAQLGAAVLAKNPNFRSDMYAQRKDTEKAFLSGGTGSPGQQVQSTNTTINHLATLAEMNDAREAGDMTKANQLMNALSKQFGGKAIPNFEAAQAMVANELTKAVQASSTGEERNERLGKLSADFSKPVVSSVAGTYTKLLGGALASARNRYAAGMSVGAADVDAARKAAIEDFNKRFLTPRTLAVLPNDFDDAPGAAPAADRYAKPGTYKHSSGATIEIQQ